jgi:hypothetical protein
MTGTVSMSKSQCPCPRHNDCHNHDQLVCLPFESPLTIDVLTKTCYVKENISLHGPVNATSGSIHDFLGIILDYGEDGMKVDMRDYIKI